MRKYNHLSLIKGIFYMSLFATITNYVSISCSFVILIIFFPLFHFKIDKKGVFFSVSILYAYFFIHALLYSPSVFLDFYFYRRDGNFFITFLPLIILGMLTINFDTKRVVKKFLFFTAFVGIFCMFFRRVSSSVGNYLFYAHNAAGGFYAVILALDIGLLFKERKNKLKILICAIISFLVLIDTDSRGSLLGIIFACFLLFLRHRAEKKGISKWNFDVSLFVFVFISSILFTFFFSNQVLDVVDSLNYSNRADAVGNAADRILNYWPRAIQLFEHSPILGTGFSSFNDLPYRIVEVVDGVFAYNASNSFYFNSAHAHNTYLHVIAETGIVGLILLIFVLNSMRKSILKIRTETLRIGLYLSFVVNVFSSFTEHRFFTPSQMLPFTIILGMILSEERKKNC